MATAHGGLTNLAIPNHDFEDLPAQASPYNNVTFQNAVNIPGANWSTFGNGYEILSQGADGAPINNSLGNPTGQSLEILGNFNNGQISLIIDIPSNVVAGSSMQLSFQAWSLDDGNSPSYFNSGRLGMSNTPAASALG